MFSRLREHLGAAGLVVAIVALVAALGGGAIAANGGGGDATASAKKGKPGPRGKTGKAGPQGPAGPAGPAGAAGVKGDAGAAGANGKDGTNGSNGTNGQSVTTQVEAPFGNCGEQSGVKLTSASGSNYVCDGADGEDGSPWTLGGTLPADATEAGVWSFTTTKDATPTVSILGKLQIVPISFGIPLSAPISPGNAIFLNETETNPNCPGSLEAPEAASGYLCIYVSGEGATGAEPLNKPPFPAANVSTAGALMNWSILGEEAFGSGSWAVTG